MQNHRNGNRTESTSVEPDTTGCGQRSPEEISRFLDNDLRSSEAARFASHLRGCPSCRTRFEAMRAQRTMLNALPPPPGGAVARARVLARFESAVVPQPDSVTRRRAIPVWAFPTMATAGIAIFIGVTLAISGKPSAFTSPPSLSRQTATVVTPAPTPIPLPETQELSALFALHDTRSGALATQDAPPPHSLRPGTSTPRGRHSDVAHAAPQSAFGLSGKTGTATAAVTPDPMNPDDIPEAL